MKKTGAVSVAVFIFLTAVMLFAQVAPSGDWFYFDDKADGGTSQVIISGTPTTDFKFVNGKAQLSGKVTTGFQYGYLGMGIDLDSETRSAIANAKGIRFKASGDGKKYRCRIETSNVTDYNYFGTSFVAGGEKTVTVNFSSLKQEEWGKKCSFDPGKIQKISFQTIGQPHSSVMLKISDLKIIK